MSMKNYYAILGIEPSADEASIKKAFRGLAKKLHPDKNDEPDAEEKFKEINEAYECLSNQSKKESYDIDRKAEEIRNKFNTGKKDSSKTTVSEDLFKKYGAAFNFKFYSDNRSHRNKNRENGSPNGSRFARHRSSSRQSRTNRPRASRFFFHSQDADDFFFDEDIFDFDSFHSHFDDMDRMFRKMTRDFEKKFKRRNNDPDSFEFEPEIEGVRMCPKCRSRYPAHKQAEHKEICDQLSATHFSPRPPSSGLNDASTFSPRSSRLTDDPFIWRNISEHTDGWRQQHDAFLDAVRTARRMSAKHFEKAEVAQCLQCCKPFVLSSDHDSAYCVQCLHSHRYGNGNVNAKKPSTRICLHCAKPMPDSSVPSTYCSNCLHGRTYTSKSKYSSFQERRPQSPLFGATTSSRFSTNAAGRNLSGGYSRNFRYGAKAEKVYA